jgi:tetratricopeptide (TPR) repeat protein
MIRLIAEPVDRGHLAKALRLAEHDPACRRPLALYTTPFTAPDGYFAGLAALLRDQYEAVRKGVAEEGVSLPPFGELRAAEPLGRAAQAIERAAAGFGERLDGVLVALVPAAVRDPARWTEAVRALARAPWSARVRLAAYDPPGGPLGAVLGAGARFSVNRADLRAYFKERFPSDPLRDLLLDAAGRINAGDPAGAAELFLKARALCRERGQAVAEAAVLVGFAGMCLQAGARGAAIERFDEAAQLARREGVWPLAAQAELGAAQVLRLERRFVEAIARYEASAEAAQRADQGAGAGQGSAPAGPSILRVEALRQAGACHLLLGAEREALDAFHRALAAGEGLDAAARGASTLPEAAAALDALLERMGLPAQAARAPSILGDQPFVSVNDAPV